MAEVARDGGNWGAPSGTFPVDGVGGFIRFGGSNKLYNIYDAGNFLTGNAFGLIGMALGTLLDGANLNSIFYREGQDSSTDQQAIVDGYNYMKVIWQKNE